MMTTDSIRPRFPLAAAVLDSLALEYSARYRRFVHALDSQRIVRGIPSVYADSFGVAS